MASYSESLEASIKRKLLRHAARYGWEGVLETAAQHGIVLHKPANAPNTLAKRRRFR